MGDLMTADRLERMRAAAERTLTARGTFQVATSTPSSTGGRTVALGAPSVAFSCRRSLPTGREATETASRFGVAPAAIISVSVGLGVSELDVITMDDGTAWSVLGRLQRGETWQVLERLAVVPA
jgi:hypothetical protein